MKIKIIIERIKNKLLYSIGVHFPYSKIRVKALRRLGHEVGENVYFPADLIITQNFTGDRGKVTIGNNVAIGPRCILDVVSHPNFSKIRSKVKQKNKEIIIEENAWIGAGVIILPGLTIGANSIVAAGAVVTKNVEPDTIVGGVPASQMINIQ